MTEQPHTPLHSGNWHVAREILFDVLHMPAAARAAALDEACADQPALRAEIESLLRAHEASEGFLESLDPDAVSALIDAHTSDSLEAGTTIGHYRIVGPLGRGGMGVVYQAIDTRLGRTVALKFLPGALSRSEVAKTRLANEARAAAALNHPNIGVIHEIGESEAGLSFIAMACYEGRTLRDRIASGPLAPAEAISIARQIADGLCAAHSRGITHRDIKPSNVMVADDGLVRIVDFGIAGGSGPAMDGTGIAAATIAYMSPEQSEAGRVDHATDVWSLGVVMHEMLAGERPFRGSTDSALVHAIRHGDPAPLAQAPASLRSVVEVCLSKDPGGRPTAVRLGRLLRDVEASIRPRPRAATVLATSAVVGLGLATLVLVKRPGASPARNAASTLAVLPFAPASSDTMLERIGRDLVVTLSSTLRDAGGMSTVDASTVLAQLTPTNRPISPDHAREIGDRLDAGRIIQGTLVRTGDAIRADAVVLQVGGHPVANVVATAETHDLATLTDSITSALLREVWRVEARALPDRTSLTTRPLPAVRAYIEGEQALARSDFEAATSAFERAFDADSTFWFAYWRSLYPRVREGVPAADTSLLRQVYQQRATFPDPDRLLLEGRFARDAATRIALLRDVTREFPHYWPGWFDYANHLIHFAPFSGSSYDQAGAALRRVVELNPSFTPAWDHLFWIAVIRRDTSLAREARLSSGVSPFESVYRALHEILLAGGELPDSTADRLVALLDAGAAPGTLEQAATGFLPFGLLEAQVGYAGIIATHASQPRVAAEFHWGRATGWAARGAWDSAFVDLDRALRILPDARLSRRAYGLAVLGAVLGSIDPDSAGRWRPDFDARTRAPAEAIAGRAWLDGVLATLRFDHASVGAARARVAQSGAAFTALLVSSLDALSLRANGQTAAAVTALLEIENRNANVSAHMRFGGSHPFVPAIHRMLASEWLIQAGDLPTAARLLTWHEAILWDGFYPVEVGNRVAEPVALMRRARIEEELGQYGPARRHYLAFLDRYDRPPSTHAAWPAEAVESLGRVTANR